MAVDGSVEDPGLRFLRTLSADMTGVQITSEEWWARDWTTAAAARRTYAELMGVSPADIHAEGPAGGPYVISYAPADA